MQCRSSFPGGEVLPFVDVEERHPFQKFALAFADGLGDLRESHAAVDEQGEVATHGLRLWERCIRHLVFLHELEECRPVNRGVDHVALYVEPLQEVVAKDAQLGNPAPLTGGDCETGGEELVAILGSHDGSLRQTEHAEDVFHDALHVECGGLGGLGVP